MDKRCIGTVGISNELVMAACLHNLPILNYSYHICVPNSGKPVSNYHSCSAHHDPIKCLLHTLLGLRINEESRLLIDQPDLLPKPLDVQLPNVIPVQQPTSANQSHNFSSRNVQAKIIEDSHIRTRWKKGEEAYRPAMTTLSIVVKDSPPLAMFLWTTTLVNQTSRDHERNRTQCKVPSPRPLARPPFFP
ncbi:hypothetical protein RJ641_035125 [Dillenia turbinata]|uniref:Uncharacterized protein n=1 Tax=Dillenia turbinata TaxID=194707 RepID=A0AAN8VJ09_9MAGN